MKEKELIALFKLFLEMNDALEGYMIAFSDRANRSTYRQDGIFGTRPTHSKLSYIGLGSRFIDYAFTWCNTDQGKEFWRDLAIKWDKVLHNVNNNS